MINVINGNGDWHRGTSVRQFFSTASKMFRPGDFYEGLPREAGGHTPPVVFLFICSIFYAIPSGMFVLEKKIFFGLLFFINAFSLPFIIAFILYLVTMLLCKGMFTYNILFGIAAYASITLFFSWIPGLAGPTEILRFCLIGLGIIKVGRITILKAFACMLCTAAAMLLLIQLLRPFLGQ